MIGDPGRLIVTKQTNARAAHLRKFARESVPRSDVDIALRVLVPSHRHDIMLELLQGRVKYETLKKWRQGRRRAPQWVRDRLAELLTAQAVALEHAILIMKANKK